MKKYIVTMNDINRYKIIKEWVKVRLKARKFLLTEKMVNIAFIIVITCEILGRIGRFL